MLPCAHALLKNSIFTDRGSLRRRVRGTKSQRDDTPLFELFKRNALAELRADRRIFRAKVL